MIEKIIEIIVTATGDTTVTTKGFPDSSCRDASRFIEQVLGEQTGGRLTAKFYQRQAVQQQARQQS